MAVKFRQRIRRPLRRRLSAARRGAIALAAALAVALPSAAALAERIASVNVSGLSTIDEADVLRVVDLKPGEEFSLQRLDAAIAHLRKWGVFDQINVSPEMTPEGVALDIELSEATVIAAIDVEGNYPYIEEKVRKFLTLHPGDIYTPERLQEQIDRIREFYAREGYQNTEVYASEEPAQERNAIILTFRIDRGDLLRYRTIEVTGNSAVLKGRFVTALNPAHAFSERRLREALREMKEVYQKKGYPKARIHVSRKEFDFERHLVDLALEVNEGPHVELVFVGAEHIGGRSMRRAVTVMSEGSIDAYEIEASAEELRKLLVRRGYPEASVTWERGDRPDGSVEITFAIDRGPEKRIRYLSFKGRHDVSRKELSRGMRNTPMAFSHRGAYEPEAREADDEAIRRALAREGYLNPAIGDWEVGPTEQGHALSITIPIDEGVRTMVADVEVVGVEGLKLKKLVNGLNSRRGKPLNPPLLEEDLRRVLAFCSDNGYPYAKADQSWRETEDGSSAIVRYEITPGAFTTIGSVLIVGDVLTSQKAIRSAMEIREGDPFSMKKIIDSQLNIRRLGPFSYVSIETIGAEEKLPIVHLKVKIEEERPFFIDLGASYSTAHGLTGTLGFSNVNAFGWAKTNSLKLTGGRDLSRAEVSWLDPRFLGYGVEMTAAGWIQYKRQPSYAFTQMAGAFGWAKRFSRLGFYFRYELDRNYFVEGDSAAANADSLRDSTISRIALSASYDTRDNFANPTKGIFTAGAVDIFNEIKGAEANFVRFTWQGEHDIGFLRRLVLSTAMRFGRIQTIGENVSVPTNELFFLGGADTIRGFGEDSLGPVDATGKATGASTRWIFNEELRVRIWKALAAAAFFDIGSLTNTFSEIDNDTIRRSAGIGLRYNTPVGPIRADYGFKLDRKAGESVGRFHFTFGYVF